MSSNPTDQTLLDSLFPIPKGAEQVFTYKTEELPIQTEEVATDIDGMSIDEVAFGNEFQEGVTENQVQIAPPESFVIIDQTLRRAPGGQQVVDVTFEIEDVENAINYEFKVTKT